MAFFSAQDFFVSNSQSKKQFELIQKSYVPRALRFSCQGPCQLREAKRAMETRMGSGDKGFSVLDSGTSGLHDVSIYCILYFPIAHNTLCLPPKCCLNYCFQILWRGLRIPKTIVYAKFGGQTMCIMGNWKLENGRVMETD